LWASTGTKNPSYSDVLYLEALIAPDTITTVPPATMDAFRDHGRVQVTLGTEPEAADAALERAAALGLDVHAITEQLQADALTAFNSSFDQLLATLAEKRRRNVTVAS
jgi:transaldolase